MKKPKNWDNVKPAGEYIELPLGAYICKILDVKENHFDKSNSDTLDMSIDIESGEYKDYYRNEYQSQTQEDKKWKGLLRYFLPKDDGSENDGWTQSTLKALIEAVEDSNPGYHFDWEHPELLKGKKLGVIFRNEEWQYQEKNGWKVRPFRGISIDAFNDKKYTLPKDKPLKNKINIEKEDFEEISSDDDLPF